MSAKAKSGIQDLGDPEKPLFENREPNIQIVGLEKLEKGPEKPAVADWDRFRLPRTLPEMGSTLFGRARKS